MHNVLNQKNIDRWKKSTEAKGKIKRLKRGSKRSKINRDKTIGISMFLKILASEISRIVNICKVKF